MMNRGLVLKAVRESSPVTAVCGVLLLGAVGVLSLIIPKFHQHLLQEFGQVTIIQNMVKAILGSEAAERFGPGALVAIPWAHPVVLALTWAHAIIFCTRVPAGEIDHGTIDILFGLPVSRWDVLRSETVVWIGSGVVLVAMIMIGNVIASGQIDETLRPESTRRLIVSGNLFCLYLAVGAFAWLISALSNRRGRAITTVFIALLASFLLDFLTSFWPLAEQLSFLSVLTYYRPLPVLRDGIWPVSDMVTLLVLATVLWVLAGKVLARRDICTV